MITNNICIVVFPVYKTLSERDRKCFEQGINMTKGFKQVFVAPESLELDETFGDLRELEVVRFEDRFFQGIEGYNSLMLSEIFYKAFTDYKYILIHQSDAFLFKPELEHWCKKDYDYVGAPWYRPYINRHDKRKIFKIKYLPFLYSKKKLDKRKRTYLLFNNVGNGGLSLRKTATFLNILGKAPLKLLKKYEKNVGLEYNEDLFWSLDAPKIDRLFKKPDYTIALKFSFEMHPIEAYKANENQLPFGCHGFNVLDTEWWKQFIPPLNE